MCGMFSVVGLGGELGEGGVELFGLVVFVEVEVVIEVFDFGVEEILVVDVGDDDLWFFGVEGVGCGFCVVMVDNG